MVDRTEHTPLDPATFAGGSGKGIKHWLKGFFFTEGVEYIAQETGASWLIDAIFLSQPKIEEALREFQVWDLFVSKGKRARLICHDGNGNRLYSERLAHTDFPERRLTLWLAGNILLLPVEY